MLTTPFTHDSSLLSAACQITTSLVEGAAILRDLCTEQLSDCTQVTLTSEIDTKLHMRQTDAEKSANKVCWHNPMCAAQDAL